MIIIGTNLRIVDNSGAKIAKCIKVIGKGNKKIAHVGNIILVTLKKFVARQKIKKSIIYIGLIVSSKYWIKRLDGTYIKFFSNRVLIFSKQFKFIGTRVYGILLKEVKIRNLKEKKKRTYFNKVITYSSFAI